MGLRMKNYKIFEVHWNIRLLGEGSWKADIEGGGLPKKGDWAVCGFKRGLTRKRGWYFWRGWWYCNAHYGCNFSSKFSIIGLNSGLKVSCKVLRLYLSQKILIFSCKMMFLEKDGTCFFSAWLCIFQLITCGGEVIFHILSWKSNFVHMRRK